MSQIYFPGSAYSRSTSSYSSSSPYPQVAIQPGSLTYTTKTLPDGRLQYDTFRAEARSYQTPQGLVHGIQWVPVNITYEIPQNAQPADADFHAAWSRPGDKATQKWQRDQEKSARKEQKIAAKRVKEWERDRREREKAEEREFRKAQELDMRGRQRRHSNVGISSDYYHTSKYDRPRSRSHVRAISAERDEVTRAMAELAMDKDWVTSDVEGKYRERRNSNAGRRRSGSVGDYERVRKISGSYADDYERSRRISGTYPAASYAGGRTYPAYYPPSPGHPRSSRGSPYISSGGLPSTPGTGPVYPPGHIYAGKPIPGVQGEIVSGSHGNPSPRRSPAPLDTPAGFSRPPSLAVPYTYFDPLLILADMNDLFQRLPRMPAVLGPHDVWPEDWVRCVEDLFSAWTEQMPLRERQRNLKNYAVVSQLIDVWNASFFSLRGVELVLYRGKHRYSGPQAGRYDDRLGLEDFSDDDESDSFSLSSDSDADERYAFYGGAYNRSAGGNPWLADSKEARAERRAERARLREKKKKQREREREKERRSRFRLALMCIGEGQPRMPPNLSYPGYPSASYAPATY